MNPKEAKGAYLTNTIQCPGEVGGKGCGSLRGLLTIRPLPQCPWSLCSRQGPVPQLSDLGEIPNRGWGVGSGGGFPFGLRLGGRAKESRTEAFWKRGRTWPTRGSDIPAVPRGRFAFMPRVGDYPGFGLRGQERRKRFDLRAEAEPPSPSARVTHRGCGWEVDPERGLNQATGPGAGGVEFMGWGGQRSRQWGVGESQGACRARERRRRGSWPARGAPFPPSAPALRIPLVPERGTRGLQWARGRWFGVTKAPSLDLSAYLRKAHAHPGAGFVLVTARAKQGTEPPSQPWARNAGAQAVGPPQGPRSGKGGLRPALECAG